MQHVANAPAGPRLPFVPCDAPVATQISRGGLAAWRVNRILPHIELNVETALQISDLAAVARFSVSHFARAFRVSFGQPPHAYVMARRIERAKRLLLSKEPIALVEVALHCGLSDQAHLCRMFRKLVGESPAAWRRKYWSPMTDYRSSESSTATCHPNTRRGSNGAGFSTVGTHTDNSVEEQGRCLLV
jgi:AraC-like DNA-binding protein